MIRGRAGWLWLAAPLLFLLFVDWDGLRCWFIADDFAWLGLIRHVHNFRDLMTALFEPAAQGTIRPWSERGFFLLFESVFGMDALPFRIMVFVTMAADLWLLGWIMRRLTGSRLAALVSQLCWTANAALATVMSWSASYNEALCPFFLLSALALFCRYMETGRRRFWWLQLVVFSLGFGALELNVVYPAIVLGFVLFVAPKTKRRELLVSVVPLVAISIVYFLIHRAVAPLPATGPYAIHLDGRLYNTLYFYLKWSLLPMNWQGFGHSLRVGRVLIVIELLGLAGLMIAEIRQRRTTIFFFALWFLATLAPMLLLPDHQDDYYLTIPTIGLAMLAGFAVSEWGVFAAIPVLAYLIGAVPVARAATHWWLMKTQPVEAIVLGVAAAHERHPREAIVVEGVSQALYEDSFGQSPFYPLEIDDVYLLDNPGSKLVPGPGIVDPAQVVLDPAVAFHAIENDEAVLYSIAGDHLRNVTESYQRFAPNRPDDRLPRRADIGNLLYSWLLGPGWLPPENGVRWMSGEASIQLGAPDGPGKKLRVEGFCSEESLRRFPRHMSVTAGGVLVGETQINDPETSFVRLFDLPASATGQNSLPVVIRVTPVERKDGQDYGLLFGKFAIVP